VRRVNAIDFCCRLYGSGHVGCYNSGSYVAADRVRDAQRASARPLVVNGRISQMVVGARSRRRSDHHRAEGFKNKWQRRTGGRGQAY